ncbi:rCG31039, isoform CRA_a [Rattus norvegicus]|uniref:RCG31039, isoform CRA_a n=1 Tax=Rattus norvegicus TaxID=10116 RepID=A6IU86_RAT|nr:rCG31039, isoform CRA_a [Rattus norvegicus]
MWGSVAVVWTVCLACIQPAVFPWILPFRSNKDRPHPARGALTEKVECFSDYMTLQISRSHVLGLRQWLAGVLRLRGTKRSPKHLDSLLPKCGYLLHPAHEGGYIFRALYSGCFVQKEKADYRLEIRMFGRGAERLKESNRFVMKCPMIVARLGEQSVSCHPSFIQTPWLLSLRGELVASLEDASVEHLPGAPAIVAGERFLCLLLRGRVPTGVFPARVRDLSSHPQAETGSGQKRLPR